MEFVQADFGQCGVEDALPAGFDLAVALAGSSLLPVAVQRRPLKTFALCLMYNEQFSLFFAVLQTYVLPFTGITLTEATRNNVDEFRPIPADIMRTPALPPSALPCS